MSFPASGKSSRPSGCSFPPLGLVMPGVGMTIPELPPFVSDAPSGKDRDRRADRDRVEQLLDVRIVERDTAPGPVGSGPAAVDEDLSAQRSIRRRDSPPARRLDDALVLRGVDRAVR